MCGEKKAYTHIYQRNIGSPPHVRGKVFNTPFQNKFKRITPACAGKSIRAAVRTAHIQDHPRMCGEKY